MCRVDAAPRPVLPPQPRTAGPTQRSDSTQGNVSTASRDRLELSRQAKAEPPDPQEDWPIVEDLGEAVQRALNGESLQIRLPNRQLPDRPLLTPFAITREAPNRYQVTLGGHATSLNVPDNAPPDALIQALQVYRQFPEELRATMVTLQLGDRPDEFQAQLHTPSGEDLPVRVAVAGQTGDKTTFDLTIGMFRFKLTSPSGNPHAFEVGEAIVLLSQIPGPLRPVLHEMAIDNGSDPDDPTFAKQFGLASFTSAATGGNAGMTFWHGDNNLAPGVFFHEFGHSLGQQFSTKHTMVPDGWEEAIAKDGRTVTEYAKTDADEDFAETWMTYLLIRNGQPPRLGPQTLAEFTQQFPARAAIVEAIFEGSRKPNRDSGPEDATGPRRSPK
jgi:hypothetical protein